LLLGCGPTEWWGFADAVDRALLVAVAAVVADADDDGDGAVALAALLA